MNFLRYKSEQLADHLRTSIAEGNLSEPLPTIRDWGAQLGVSLDTIQAALKILKREGWLSSRPRQGLQLVRKRISRKHPLQPPVARWLSYRRDDKHNPFMAEILTTISQNLTAHGIGFNVEICDDSSLKAIYREKARPHELLLLSNLPPKQLKSFETFQSALVIGLPAQSVRLPYISIDVFSAIRHAIFLLCRHGFERISLVHTKGNRQQIELDQILVREFKQICALAPRPIQGEILWVPDKMAKQYLAIQQLAQRIRGRHGFVTNAPVSPGLLMMALMNCGLKIPGEVEVVAVNCLSQQAFTFPSIIHYPYPLERISNAVYQVANHYFKQGALPDLRKVIPLTMVSPSRDQG
jgi:DNA-binding transcriptional regulator YhcF (GntR family)